jgi:hypothetical protein
VAALTAKRSIRSARTESSGAHALEPTYRAKFRRLERLVTLLAERKIYGVFCSGQPGISKTTTVLRVLAELGLHEGKDFVVFKGHTSPLGLYTSLYEASQTGRVCVYDDSDVAFSRGDGINIVKAALDDKPTRMISFVSSRLPPGVPTQFAFSGQIIFISNLTLGSIDAAIQSRCHCVELHLTRDEVLDFIEREVLPKPHLNSTQAHRRYVLWRYRAALCKSLVVPSVRLYRQLLDLWCHDRDYFNEHVDALLPRSDELSLVRKLLESHDTVKEAAAAFAAATGKSARTFFLLKAKWRDFL